MAFASEALSPNGLPRFQVPAFPALSARRLAGKGVALGLVAGGSLAVLAVSLSVASVWTRAVSHNAPTTLHMSAPAAPLISALGEWHRGMIRDAARSGPASGFGTAPDSEPQEIDLAPVIARAPLAAPKPLPPATVAAPPPPAVHVPVPRPRPKIHVSELAPPAAAPPAVTVEAAPVPLPLARPRIAEAAPEVTGS